MTRPPVSILKAGLLVVLLLGLVVLTNQTLGVWLKELGADLSPETVDRLERGLWLTTLLYALLLAVPFVPGIEIGIGMLSMFGAAVAPQVYVATIIGLSIAYWVGRLVPLRILARGALALRMRRTAALLARMDGESEEVCLALLFENAPTRALPWLLSHRYLALAILLNLPGAALIGGGGGIALAAGLSRIYPPSIFLLVVALAVAPVPFTVWVLG